MPDVKAKEVLSRKYRKIQDKNDEIIFAEHTSVY